MPLLPTSLPAPTQTFSFVGGVGPKETMSALVNTLAGIFFIPTHAFNVTSEKVSPSSLIRDLLLFSSGRFIVLAVTFRSAIRLEFIFVYDRRKGF